MAETQIGRENIVNAVTRAWGKVERGLAPSNEDLFALIHAAAAVLQSRGVGPAPWQQPRRNDDG